MNKRVVLSERCVLYGEKSKMFKGKQQMSKIKILTGVNYFAGWWEPLPNKWRRHGSSQSSEYGDDWRPDFPERVPLLGCFNTQETMDKEILAAAEYGVDFFPILWYYNEKDSEREPHSHHLNNGLKHFIASPNADRMRFFIEFCNHPPYEVQTDQQWRECLESWSEAFGHPSYLTVGERLVFKVHGAFYFIQQNNGDLARCKKQLDSLRAAAKQATGKEMIIGGGVMAAQSIGKDDPISEIFDFTCTYMDIPPYPRIEGDYPYEMLGDLCRAARHIHTHDAKPYMPYLPGGWSPRPWPDKRACFELPNRSQWAEELKRMKEDLQSLPNMGLPLPDGTLQPAFNIYAWNEFGEGGIVAPTQRFLYMKLEEIKKAFKG